MINSIFKTKFAFISYIILFLLTSVFTFTYSFKNQYYQRNYEPVKLVIPYLSNEFYKNITSGLDKNSILHNMKKKIPSNSAVKLVQLLYYKNNEIKFDFIDESNCSDSEQLKKYSEYKVFDEYFKNANITYTKTNDKELIAIIPIFNNFAENERIVIIFELDYKTYYAILLIILAFLLALIPLVFIQFFFRNKIQKDIFNITSIIINGIDENKQSAYYAKLKKPLKKLYEKIIYHVINEKNTVEAYNKLKNQFEFTVDNSIEGIVLEDESSKITFVNKKFMELLGYTNAFELIDKDVADLLFDDASYKIYRSHTEQRDSKQSSKYSLNFKRKNGKPCELFVSGSAQYDKDGSIIQYLATVSNLNALVNINKEFANVVSLNIPNSIEHAAPLITLDEKNHIFAVNSHFSNLVNISQKDMINQNIRDCLNHFEEIYSIISIKKRGSLHYEIFEPYINKWIFINKQFHSHKDSILRTYTFVDITSFKSIEKYHELLFDQMDGFVFFTDMQDSLTFISQSFTAISEQDTTWFEEYLNKVFSKLYLQNGQLITNEIIMIFLDREPRKFAIYQTINDNKNSKFYICNLIK